MRRFLLTALFLLFILALAGALTGSFLAYNFHQRKQIQLDASSTRIANLERSLGETERDLDQAERQLDELAQNNRELGRQTADQARTPTVMPEPSRVHPPTIPTPTPPMLPTVSILSPLSGTQFDQGEIVMIRWLATNPDRVGRVSFYVDGRPTAETATEQDQRVEGEFRWNAFGLGEHQLMVVAANTLGGEGAPAVVTVEVVPAADSRPPVDQENDRIMDDIESVVIGLRGLETLAPVTRTLFTRDELGEYVIQALDKDYPLREAQRDAIEMAAFDFISVDTDLKAVIGALYIEQIAGFYDADSRSLTVISGEGMMGPLEKSTYAHEFVHALQDQHYGLKVLDPEENSDDASLAVTALIEGDAMLVQQQFMLEHLDSNELFEMLSELSEVSTPRLDNAPAVIRDQLLFPYENGLIFVQTLFQAGGLQAVNDAFLNPPVSTEQILHPGKYLAGELPQLISVPALTETLGGGWTMVDENVLGEFTLRLYLEQYIDHRPAIMAAEGWDGDRYAVFYNQATGGIVLVMRIAWDSAEEATEFVESYVALGEARFDMLLDGWTTAACWSGADSICVYQAAAETLIIRAPEREIVTRLKGLFPDY